MTRYTAKEAVATHTMMDIAEMNDHRYQPHDWTMPVWDFGDVMFTARKTGSKKLPKHRYDEVMGGSQYDWLPVFTWHNWEVLKGTEKEEA